MEELDNIYNRNKVAIIIVGYNRLVSIKRVLKSTEEAKYPVEDIPLIISIDCGGVQDLYDYVLSYRWPHGDKYVNIENKRLGLKEHLFKCCGFSEFFKGVIVLEDDSFVSPYYYHFALKAIDRYGDDDLVCGISLYMSHNNEYVNIPFYPYNNGSDVFLLQDVQTRGECFTYSQWSKFKTWLPANNHRDFSEIYMPERVKGWKRAWSKYYYAYMVEARKYFVYPCTSFVTNMGAVGEHGTSEVNIVQVCLEWGHKEYVFPNSDTLERYDAFYCNEKIYDILELNYNDLCIDYYGFNPNIQNRRYILTYKKLPYRVIRSFGLKMYPVEVNVFKNITGDGLYLYDTHHSDIAGKSVNNSFIDYIYCKHNPKLMRQYVINWDICRIKNKIKSIFDKK